MNVWLDGRLLAEDAAQLRVTDRGLLLGDGVFETLRVEAGQPCHLAQHLARLRDGAAVLGIPVRWSDADIAAAMAGVLAGGLEGARRAAVRVTLSRGPAPRGVLPPDAATPTLLVTAGPLPPPAPPARVILAACTRRNEASPLSRIKSLNYLDSVLARREAAAAGADDALLLNTQGQLAEATAANLFVSWQDGSVFTPPVADGALPGLFRARMLAAGAAREGRLWPGHLAQAGAVLLGNSLGVRLVSAVDGHRFDTESPVAQLLRALAAAVA